MTRIRVLSYNVRYDNKSDHHDVWTSRRDGVVSLLRFHRPDVVGLQEPLPHQRRDLREQLSAYEFVGRGRQEGGEGEGCPVAVRRDRWTVADSGTFWLSETPDEPSVGWDASHPRIATWARIEPRTEPADGVATASDLDADAAAPFVVLNTHLDHLSARARREGAALIHDRLPGIADGHPAVVVGDFNSTAGSEPHRILTAGDLRDAADAADVRHGPATSITDFETLIDGRRIDHVLCPPEIEVRGFATLADRDERGRFPSDHLPVLAQLRLA